jgi:hypothetical protein
MEHYANKDTKIKLLNVYVKSVLLYGCQTWLVTCEIQRKLQSFVNRFLRYIMKIWWPRVISNVKLWEMTGQININKEIRNLAGLDIHSVKMIVNRARQLCSVEPTRYKRKGQAKEFMATNYTERKWEAQLE